MCLPPYRVRVVEIESRVSVESLRQHVDHDVAVTYGADGPEKIRCETCKVELWRQE